jgi:hypothetical protein
MRSLGLAVIAVGLAGACGLPGSADFTSGGGPDAGADVAIADAAGPPGVTGVEAGTSDAGDSGASLGCKAYPTAIFCADFDGNPFDVGFTHNADGTPPGQLDVDRTVFASAPAAALASLGARSGSGPKPDAYLYHQLPDATSSFRLSWSAAYEDQGTQEAVDFGISPVKQTTGVYHSVVLRYHHGPDGSLSLQLFEYGAPDGAQPEVVEFTPLAVPPPAPGRFARYELDLVQSAGASSVSVFVDGTEALANHALSFHVVSGPVGLRVGVASSDGVGSPFVVRVDDVVVEPPR